ncbi:MAG: nucleotide exchange factor GrpE [Candidatus Woesearchaeota archaeon]
MVKEIKTEEQKSGGGAEIKKQESLSEKEKSQSEKGESCTVKLSEMTDLLKRKQAEFENYKKQSETRNQEQRKMAGREMILQIFTYCR